MIITNTIIKNIDNSGISSVKCIKVLNKKKSATIGDIIVVSINKRKHQYRLKKKISLTQKIFFSLIVSLKSKKPR